MIGHHFFNLMDTSLVIKEIGKAYVTQNPTEPVIMQIDLDIQYASCK